MQLTNFAPIKKSTAQVKVHERVTHIAGIFDGSDIGKEK